jgi:hypothetical protein
MAPPPRPAVIDPQSAPSCLAPAGQAIKQQALYPARSLVDIEETCTYQRARRRREYPPPASLATRHAPTENLLDRPLPSSPPVCYRSKIPLYPCAISRAARSQASQAGPDIRPVDWSRFSGPAGANVRVPRWFGLDGGPDVWLDGLVASVTRAARQQQKIGSGWGRALVARL